MKSLMSPVIAIINAGPVGEGMTRTVDWLLNHAQPVFLVIDHAINGLAGAIEQILSVPAPWLLDRKSVV